MSDKEAQEHQQAMVMVVAGLCIAFFRFPRFVHDAIEWVFYVGWFRASPFGF